LFFVSSLDNRKDYVKIVGMRDTDLPDRHAVVLRDPAAIALLRRVNENTRIPMRFIVERLLFDHAPALEARLSTALNVGHELVEPDR
jgi:hypothetical protein